MADLLPPKGVKDISSLAPRRQAEIAFASASFERHWRTARPIPYKPHPKQVAFHALVDSVRFVAFIAGRGTGKSKGGAAEAVKQGITNAGATGIIAAPTYKMLAAVTKPAFFSVLNEDAIHKYDKTDEHVILTNGTHIWFRSTEDPDSLRGIDASWFWLDEGAYALHGAWNVIIACLRQPGYPHHGFITTTPCGMNWVWDRFASPSKPIGYGMVQASSRDNPFLSKDDIDSLVASYAGTFREQEVEGKFMGFEGLVYPLFDRAIHCGQYRSEKWRKETIREVYYGHDWGFTNPMVVNVYGVDGDGRIYLMDEFYEKGAVIGDVISKCKEFHARYGEGPHVCDPSEPGLIEEMSRAGFHMVGADNSIIDGIQRLTARLEPAGDGRPRFFVDENCSSALMEFGTYRWEETKEGKPVKEKPIKLFDHSCLPAGTPIETESGPVPIEKIEAGMNVWTRSGLRPVLESGMTSPWSSLFRTGFSDGSTLISTGNHPVWVEGKGFTRMDALRYGDKCLMWRRSSTTASPSSDTQVRTTNPVNATTNVSRGIITNDCSTGQSGEICTGQSHPAITYTMSTGTTSTTTRPISNCLLNRSIIDTTGSGGQKNGSKRNALSWLASTLWPRYGTRQMKESSGIASTASAPGNPGGSVALNATTAASVSTTSADRLGSVTTTASLPGAENSEATTSTNSALYVESTIAPADTQGPRPVPCVVEVISAPRPVGCATVYNISVADQPEYFANGILLHNCDASRYMASYLEGSGGQWGAPLNFAPVYANVTGQNRPIEGPAPSWL